MSTWFLSSLKSNFCSIHHMLTYQMWLLRKVAASSTKNSIWYPLVNKRYKGATYCKIKAIRNFKFLMRYLFSMQTKILKRLKTLQSFFIVGYFNFFGKHRKLTYFSFLVTHKTYDSINVIIIKWVKFLYMWYDRFMKRYHRIFRWYVK